MARTAKMTGARRKNDGWEAYVDVDKKRYTKQYHFGNPLTAEERRIIQTWREEMREKHEGQVPASGSFAADIQRYLAQNATMPTIKQRAAQLELWAEALGRDRARRTIKTDEINLILQEWKVNGRIGRRGKGPLAGGSLRKRRTALQSLFQFLDGSKVLNPVKAVPRPPEPEPEARWIDYAVIGTILKVMPTHCQPRKRGEAPKLSLAPIRCAVLAHTGIPPGLLKVIVPADLRLTKEGAAYRMPGRKKGRGTAARLVPLTAEGRQAFEAFHAANAYGKYSVDGVNSCFKRAAKRAGVDPTTVHLYDLRHSFGSEMYRLRRDLATVGRFLGHAPGSKETARYAKGANFEVDLAAAAAFSAARQASLPAPGATPAAQPVGASGANVAAPAGDLAQVLAEAAQPVV